MKMKNAEKNNVFEIEGFKANRTCYSLSTFEKSLKLDVYFINQQKKGLFSVSLVWTVYS